MLSRRKVLTALGLCGGQAGAIAATISPATGASDAVRQWSVQNSSAQRKAIVTPEEFGAIGDGRNDDTEAIQRAIDSRAQVVQFRPGAVYLVRRSGSMMVGDHSTAYCLNVKSNIRIDLNSSTIKLALNANACIFVGNGVPGEPLQYVKIVNGTLDGNRTEQSYPDRSVMACMFFANAAHLVVDSIVVLDARDYSGLFLNSVQCQFTNLTCLGSDGQGWEFGTAYRGQEVRDAFIDNIYAERCSGLRSMTLPGNPATFAVVNCCVGKVIGRNCGAGIKIQDSARYSQFSELLFDGSPLNAEPAYGTANSGIKLQSNPAKNWYVRGVTIGSVISRNCAGSGMYLFRCIDCRVESYYGENNEITAPGNYGDVWLGGTRCFVSTMTSIGCRDSRHAIYIRAESVDCHAERIVVDDCIGFALNVESNHSFTFGKLQAEGGRMTFALNLAAPTCRGRGEIIVTTLPVPGQSRIKFPANAAQFSIGSLLMSESNGLTGTFTLSTDDDITIVENQNCHRIVIAGATGAAFVVQPHIDLVPLTKEARKLQQPETELMDVRNGSGFRLVHKGRTPSNCKFLYKLREWRQTPLES